MAEVGYLIPKEGAVHTPNTLGGPWAFQYNGQWHKITDGNGKPKPFPMEMATVGLGYFTRRGGGIEECLVDLRVEEAELTWSVADPQQFEDPETGAVYATLDELVSAVKERSATPSGSRREEK